MPEGHEGEDGEDVENATGSGEEAGRGGWVGCLGWALAAAEWNVEVPYDPAVERAVPASPEGEGGVIVGHAADHVLGRVDAVDECPETEEAPWDQQFQPDDVEVEEGQHAQLAGAVHGPIRGCFGDCHGVDVVQDELHAEKSEEEPEAVKKSSGTGYGWSCVSLLGDVVVEGENGAGEIQRSVEHIGDVIPGVECGWFSGDIDAVSFR